MQLPDQLSRRARGLASAYHVNIDPVAPTDIHGTPVLVPLDDHGRSLLHIRQPGGVDYYISRIDYFNPDYRVTVSRLILMVLPGYRTRSAYLPNSRSARVLEVHQGVGSLILGNPPHDEEDFPTAIYPLNPTVTPSVTVPPNHFYTLEAASWSQEPLVVSEMFEIKGEGELRNAEIVVSPGQKTITTPDGPIDVPEEFREGIFT